MSKNIRGFDKRPTHTLIRCNIAWYREGNGTLLRYSWLENPMDGGAWWAEVHGVARSQTRLSDFPFTFHFHALEKEMATHSSVLAWRIPGTGEPGGLPSMGSYRVGHDWSDLAAAAAAVPERRNVEKRETERDKISVRQGLRGRVGWSWTILGWRQPYPFSLMRDRWA